MDHQHRFGLATASVNEFESAPPPPALSTAPSPSAPTRATRRPSDSTSPQKRGRRATAEPPHPGAMARRCSTLESPPRMSHVIHVAFLACAMLLLTRIAGADARHLTSFTVETADLKIKGARVPREDVRHGHRELRRAPLRRHTQVRDPTPPPRSQPKKAQIPRHEIRTREPRLTPSFSNSHRSGGLAYPTSIDASYRTGCQHFVSTRPPPRPTRVRPLPRTHESILIATGKRNKKPEPTTKNQTPSPPPRPVDDPPISHSPEPPPLRPDARISPPATSSRNKPASAPPSSSSTAEDARSRTRRTTRNPAGADAGHCH